MKMKRLLTALCLVGFSYLAAAEERGNGGDVLICINLSDPHEGVKLEMLDFYEARLRRMNIDLGDESMDFWQKSVHVIERLKTIDPEKYARYMNWLNHFAAEMLVVDEQLVDIPDSGHLGVPNGCRIEQIAVQHEPLFPQDPRYRISQTLWEKLDENNKAGLILHEIVYRDAIEKGHANSIRARYFMTYLAGDMFKNMKPGEYGDFLIQYAKLADRVFIAGIPFVAGSVFFGGNGNVQKGLLYQNTEFPVFERKLRFVGYAHLHLAEFGQVEFHANGNIKSASLESSAKIACSDGTYRDFPYYSRVAFDEVGKALCQ